jgi:hypothetical protein
MSDPSLPAAVTDYVGLPDESRAVFLSVEGRRVVAERALDGQSPRSVAHRGAAAREGSIDLGVGFPPGAVCRRSMGRPGGSGHTCCSR